MDISNSIRLHRNKSGLTQKQLAEKLNVTPQAVSRWEKGIVEPDISTLKQMAEIFDSAPSNSSMTPNTQTSGLR